MISKLRELTTIAMIWIAFKIAPKEMAEVMQEAFELGLRVQKAAYDQALMERNGKLEDNQH